MRQQVGTQRNGKGHHAWLRHDQAAQFERLRQDDAVPGVGRREDPRLVDELRELDLAAAGPLVLHSNRQNQLIIKKIFHVQIVVLAGAAPHQPGDDEIKRPVPQRRQLQRWSDHWNDVRHHVRIMLQELPKQRRQHRGRRRFRAPDPHFSHRRIGQKLDIPDALLQFIEGGLAPQYQRAAVGRCLDTPWATIEQPHADRVLELGNHSRHG